MALASVNISGSAIAWTRFESEGIQLRPVTYMKVTKDVPIEEAPSMTTTDLI
jgi:hypothetical protein